MEKVITVSSIRGGVGKTSLSLEMAVNLTLKGKVLLIDADFYGPSLINEIQSRNKSVQEPSGYFRDILLGYEISNQNVVDILPNLSVIFSNPQVNLWELNKDIGSKYFWIEDDTSKPSKAELGLAKLKEYIDNHNFDFVMFDTFAGYSYPAIYFIFISHFPIILNRPSIPQISDISEFIKLCGKTEKKINLVWSYVPSHENFMEKTRDELEEQLISSCRGLFRNIGFIPRDDEFEQHALMGTHELKPNRSESSFFTNLNQIINNLIFD